MSKLLVTGGAGFVGGHTVQRLLKDGHEIVIIDDLSNGHIEQAQGCELHQIDIRDIDKLQTVFEAHQFDAVLHFAAQMEAGKSVQEPALFYDVNVNGTYALLACMEKAHVEKLVFSPTAAVYGQPEETPIPETAPLAPVNPYGETKMICETMLNNAHRKWGLSYAALRYFNAAGSDPAGKIGERHNPETHLIPLCIDAALGKRPPLKLFGTDYNTPDGTCIRDYIHVCDLADAHAKALNKLEDAPVLTLNLGTGRGHSVLDVIKTVEKISGKKVPYEKAPRRAGDPAVLVCAPDKANAALNWLPEYPRLEDMVTHCLRYRQTH